MAGVQDLEKVLGHLKHKTGSLKDVHAYICGPPAMVHSMVNHLRNAGFVQEQLYHEQWW